MKQLFFFTYAIGLGSGQKRQYFLQFDFVRFLKMLYYKFKLAAMAG